MAIAICAIDAAIFGMPHPIAHDEFSYLLAADTFAHGRLSNPSHPMWRYLEEFHVLQEPTRASKFPPGMGLVLALGMIGFGHPIVGVWLTTGLACAATVWALRALVPPYWAWLGGVLLALHPIMHLWGTNYWGGSLAVLGGALALGAFLRLQERVHLRNALLFGLGLAILSLTRPFEGAVLGAILGIALAARSLGSNGLPLHRSALRLWLPIGASLAVAGLAIGCYNAAVTGRSWLMPYVVYTAQYDIAPVFLWQSLPPPPRYDYEIFRQIGDWEYAQYAQAQTAGGLLDWSFFKIGILFSHLLFAQSLLAVALLALPVTLARSSRARWLAMAIAIFLLGLCGETYMQLHYAAPLVPVVFGLMMLCLRRIHVLRIGERRSGRLLVRLGLIVVFVAAPFEHPGRGDAGPGTDAVTAGLERLPGKHLVIVRYAPDHNPHVDWIHNRADIDAARVVWARDRGDGDRDLIDYFRDRSVWLLDADRATPTPVPYEPQAARQ